MEEIKAEVKDLDTKEVALSDLEKSILNALEEKRKVDEENRKAFMTPDNDE